MIGWTLNLDGENKKCVQKFGEKIYFKQLLGSQRKKWGKKYEEELKSNLNIAIKSQNHVVDGCTTDMLCPPA
jgi:hypothetical protein